MSLINETLNNLKDKAEVKGDKGQRAKAFAQKPRSTITLLALLAIFGLTIAMVLSKGASVKQALSNGLSWTSGLSKSGSSLPESAQLQYYEAINALNEGNASYAMNNLREIMDKYPKFAPAKEAYDRLK